MTGQRQATPGPRRSAGVTDSSGPPPLLAFVDESFQVRAGNQPIYLMAAAIVTEPRCDAIRSTMRDLLLTRQARIHWRDESTARRTVIAEAVVAADVDGLVVVGTPVAVRRQERARRKVLERLLWELDRRQVSNVLLESRHAERNAHDRKALGAFRSQHVISRRLVVGFTEPIQEPLLWLPDAIAGAVGDDQCGELTGACRPLVNAATTITVALR